MRAEDLLRLHFVGDPRISPDGSQILFTKKHVGEKNDYVTNLYTVDVEGRVRQWTQAKGGSSQGRWSSDGAAIAFLSGRDKPGQIFVIATDGGEARKLTNLPEGYIGEFRWSPDGKLIAFTFRETHQDWTEKAAEERKEKGLSTPAREIESALYREDGDGYFLNDRYAIYIADVATGAHRKLYAEDVAGTYSFDWAPDSSELAVSHSANKRPFAEPSNDQIWRVDMQGQSWRLEGQPKGSKGTIRWSPDGARIAYLGDVDEDDPWGVRNLKVYVVPADGGAPECLSSQEDYDMGVATLSDTKEGGDGVLEWMPDGQSLIVQIGHHGEQHLGRVSLAGEVAILTSGQRAISVGNVSADGKRIAGRVCDATRLDEICVLEQELATGTIVPRVLTNFNGAFHDEVRLSEPQEAWVESQDGTKVHTWVIKPADYLEPKRYPAVLEIHGGPHTQYGWALFHEFQLLAAQGYVVVYSNPRGSKGYGEAHTAAIRGNWGDKDWQDVQAVIRWMQHQSYIHPGQMGVMGGSYGGYMTNWAIGHCDDFKAAITDRCVSNMVSMAGSSDFPFNKDGYFKGVAWGDLEAIRELWKQSPLAYFEKVTTPTLIIHSEGDLRCNIEQSEQVFAALQQMGVESRFVRYPQETSHGMSRGGPPDLRLHRLREIVSWWKRHLG